MAHLPDLIKDLGLILIAAAVVTLVFKKLRQPVVLGYLIAGLLVGPHFPWMPTVADPEAIQVWAEIGVIFLLFGLGLEFSFRKLAEVGKPASITAIFEAVFMLGLGFLVGRFLGWSQMDSLFLGGVLSISSTTIIVRAFEELGMKGRRFVSLVFGVLIVEDLVAILLLVLLSTVAVTQTLSGGELAFAALRLGFFLALWFVIGIFLLPAILRRIGSLLNEETTLVVSIGLCLLMVILATEAGFSAALGAFVMGSLLAETPQGKRIEHLILPVRNLFAAVFFVSVGMMIDPGVLRESWEVILVVSVVTLAGKFISTTLGAILAGQSLKHSVQSGMSLAQIGEFSFIIASLGMTLGVTSKFLSPIAIAVSAVTTFTTPYLIKNADPFYAWIDRHLPSRLRRALENYQRAVLFHSDRTNTRTLWRNEILRVMVLSVLFIALVLTSEKFFWPLISSAFDDATTVLAIVSTLTMLTGSLILGAILFQKNQQQGQGSVRITLILVRVCILVGLMIFLASRFALSIGAASALILLGILALTLFARFSQGLYGAIEASFKSNFGSQNGTDEEATPPLAPWDAGLAELILSTDSPLIAKTLSQAMLREKFGVTVALIERGKKRIPAPSRDELLLPADRLYIIGTDEQLAALRPLIEEPPTATLPEPDEAFGLEPLPLGPGSPFAGRTIRESGLREAASGLIVGIERDNQRILNPDSSLTLLEGDLLWIVGPKRRLREMA